MLDRDESWFTEWQMQACGPRQDGRSVTERSLGNAAPLKTRDGCKLLTCRAQALLPGPILRRQQEANGFTTSLEKGQA